MQVIRLSIEQMDDAAQVMRASYDAALPWLTGRHTPAEDCWFFREAVFPRCSVWGGYVAAQLAGVIAVRPGWIEQLYVAPTAQGVGLGSALLEVGFGLGSPLQLWTFQRNLQARAFYERRGFYLVEQTDGARNEEREPDARYRWQGRT